MTRRPSEAEEDFSVDDPAVLQPSYYQESRSADEEQNVDAATIGVAAADEDAAAIAAVAGPPGRWQVQAGPAGGWVDFDEQTSRMLDQQRLLGSTVVKFSARGMTYEINLQEMVQANVRTGKQRPIRNLSTT